MFLTEKDELRARLRKDLASCPMDIRETGVRVVPWNSTSGWIMAKTKEAQYTWTYHEGLIPTLMLLGAFGFNFTVESEDEQTC